MMVVSAPLYPEVSSKSFIQIKIKGKKLKLHILKTELINLI